MNVNLYYFSGTGNSLFIAKTIKEEIEKEESQSICHQENEDSIVKILPIQRFTNCENIEDQSDIVGIIYPTYFLDAPRVVKQFAKRLQLKKGSYLFLYANYGETLGNALHNINKIFAKSCVGGNYEVALPDNSIIFETKKEKIPKMLEQAEKTIKAQAKEIFAKAITKKSSYHFGYHLVTVVMKPLANTGLGFNNMKVNQTSCNGCGLCEKICPMKNIHLEKNKVDSNVPVFDKRCESCFSCMHYCPKEAISYKFMSKKKTEFQYQHPDISVKEMIDANKR